MSSIAAAVDRLDWRAIAAQLDEDGHAVLPGLLDAQAARDLARRIDAAPERHGAPSPLAGSGGGGQFRFGTRLPAPLEAWRTTFYRHLAVIANRWNEVLGVGYRYPAGLDEFLQRNRQAGQLRPQSHWSRLGVDGYLPLHRPGDGEHVFPLQLVALLSAPGKDFEGGELVATERRPRMQSRPMVLPLALGDAAVVAAAERPFRGSRGHYRVDLEHAVGRVRRGERIGVELSFHDAR